LGLFLPEEFKDDPVSTDQPKAEKKNKLTILKFDGTLETGNQMAY